MADQEDDWCLSGARSKAFSKAFAWISLGFKILEWAATERSWSWLSGCIALQKHKPDESAAENIVFPDLFSTDKSSRRLPLTSTFSWIAPCPTDVFLSFLSPQASLQIRPLSLPGPADCDAWLSVFSKSPLVPGSRPPPLAQTAIKMPSVAAQPVAWKWEDGEERGRDGESGQTGRENTLVLAGSHAEKRDGAWDEGKAGMAREKMWEK